MARQDLLEQRRPRPRQADDEDRVGCGRPAPRARAQELRRKQSLRALHLLAVPVGLVSDAGAAQTVTLLVVLEGRSELPSVLQCLAEREVKVEAILFIQVGSLQLRAHRSDVRLREPEGLQVREAPIGLAEMRRQLDTLAIGAETLVLATGRLQRMAVAHPDLGVARILGEHVCIQPDRLLVFADTDEDGSLQVSIAGIARLGFERAVDLRQRRRCFVLTMQHERVVVTRSCEAGRELQAALQHALGIGIASEPSSDLRQHAQRRHVRGMLLEVCTQ